MSENEFQIKLNAFIDESREYRGQREKIEAQLYDRISSIGHTVTELESLMRGVMGQRGLVETVARQQEMTASVLMRESEIEKRMERGDMKFELLSADITELKKSVGEISRKMYVALGIFMTILWLADKVAVPFGEKSVTQQESKQGVK